MQIMLILGIVFAIGAVTFALQNTATVVVTLAIWQFDGTLAVVLLVAIGLGVLITGLLSSPAVIRRQWANSRLRRQVVDLEGELASAQQRIHDYAVEIDRLAPATEIARPEEERSYVGLRTILAGDESVRPPGP